jgi:pyruvate kinase
LGSKDYPLRNNETMEKYCKMAVDGFMIETMIQEENPLDIITEVFELLNKHELNHSDEIAERFENDEDFAVRDYIIYNSYRITKEMKIKAIVCFTDNGYTSARLSALAPKVPVITFTKSDETYRYLNMIWGVK